MELTRPSVIKQIMEKYGFRFSKSLGQNFLIEKSVLERIIDGADITQTDSVLEIGPGIGTLTRYLAQNAAKVVSVEIDSSLLPILEETLSDLPNTAVVHGDVLKVDLKALIAERFDNIPPKVVANLPYYVTTPIVMKFLEEEIPVTDLVVMVQKEVADRMAAKPGGKDYGALSVAVQYFCEPEILFKVSTGCFMPAPTVESSVIRLRVLQNPKVQVISRKLFFATVRGAFGKRRKTLLNALSDSGLAFSKDQVKQVLAAAGIDPIRRAETLTIEEFAVLANAVAREKGVTS